MTSTETVAVIGAISTTAVAIAGYGFNVWRASQDRKAAKDMAVEAQAHELRLAQGSRAYGDRKDADRRVVAYAVRTMNQVELTLPMLEDSDTPKPPENLPPDAYEAMNTEIALFGSPAAAEAFKEFLMTLQPFRAAVWAFEAMKNQAAMGAEVTGSFGEVHKARESVRATFETLTSTIRDELASL
jgi:hypothetical protein